MAIYASDPVNNMARFASLQKQNVMSKEDIDAVRANMDNFTHGWFLKSKVESKYFCFLI